MQRDYMLVSPSLDGVLRHDSVTYEGVKRPAEVLRILDGPSSRGQGKDGNVVGHGRKKPPTEAQIKVLEEYFNDIYGVFMKRLSHFVVAASVGADDIVKLQALFQELIKIKELMGRGEK